MIIVTFAIFLMARTLRELRLLRRDLKEERETLLAKAKRMLHRIRKLARRIKRKQRRGLPNWLPTKFADEWRKPWTVDPASGSDKEFKQLIWNHGYVSPNFLKSEASGKSRHPQGCDVPSWLRNKCQFHAFKLERARHKLGDKSMNAGSWYRCGPHNDAVGGASGSEHMQAWGTDWFSDMRAKLGGERFDQVMEDVFSGGGRGYQGFTGGPIRHVDNGAQRTWIYA